MTSTANQGAESVAHTPGTWFVDKDDSDFTVSSEHGQEICRCLSADDFPCLEEGTEEHMNDEARANAAFIVRACKSYDAMLAALKSLLRAHDKVFRSDNAAAQARAAIALAEGREPSLQNPQTTPSRPHPKTR